MRTADEVARLPALTPELQQLLTKIREADTGQLAISEEDGRFLRLMVVLNRTKKAIEIGGASGYSAIWLGLGLRETGGRLTTIEYDPVRAQELKANIAAARLGDVVTVVAGDAFKAVPAEPGTFDFVFIDAWKPDYQKYFDMTFPRRAAWRAHPRAQRHQQGRGHAGLPQDGQHPRRPPDRDRRPRQRGRVDQRQALTASAWPTSI